MLISKFFEYFSENKYTFFKFSALSFLAGILELFGVALTYPLVIKLLENKPYYGIFSPLAIGIIIVALFIFKNLFMILYTNLQTKYAKSVQVEINLKFMKYFLSSSYQQTSKISIAEKNNIFGFIIPNIIDNYILRLLNLCVNFFIFGLISLFLIIKFPTASVITLFFASILIISQNSFFRPKLNKIAKNLNQSSIECNQKTNEAIINIKNVKASKNEKQFYENHKKALESFSKNHQKSMFLNIIPPYITEPFIIILLFIMLAVISFENIIDPQKLIASFALIVSAIFRLAPTISRIQVNLNGINTAKPILQKLLNYAEVFDLNNLRPLEETNYQHFGKNIKLVNINFGYEQDKQVLHDINLEIEKGSFIGIAGLSGAGKTTLVDIISGLLTPNSGEILADGEKLSNPLSVSYIPQEFSTISASIRENVAFGSKNIDDEKIIEALKQAQLYDFIQDNFKEGIYANPFIDSIGFSQGQKQRLAIARALYQNQDILILDEATSSLDLKTEDELCNILESLKGQKTIIAIAHRLSTIKSADNIVFMQNGAIQNIAPFDKMVDINKSFKELVELGSLN